MPNDNISTCPNSCQPVPDHELFRVKLLEVAIFNNTTGVLNALKLAGLRIKEISSPPYFRLEA